MPNRIKLALALYGTVEGVWVREWMKFQAQVAAYKGYAGMVLMDGSCYVHMNRTQLAAVALKDERPWDYLLMLDQDMVLPEGLLDRIGTYQDPIVGVHYFGRVMENQRSVAGRFLADGAFQRFEDEEIEAMLDAPGLHPCGAVGMGCTAIHRSVFEQWDPEIYPWFQCPNTPQMGWGEDVWFCRQAAQQGWTTMLDTAIVVEHLGSWRSGERTFRARLAYDRRLAALQEPTPVG